MVLNAGKKKKKVPDGNALAQRWYISGTLFVPAKTSQGSWEEEGKVL